VVVISAEGSCFLFNIKNTKNEIFPLDILRVPCNITSMLFNSNEIIFGSTDRNIYIYNLELTKTKETLSCKLVLKKKYFCDKQVFARKFLIHFQDFPFLTIKKMVKI
jgi:hypothetical protein